MKAKINSVFIHYTKDKYFGVREFMFSVGYDSGVILSYKTDSYEKIPCEIRDFMQINKEKVVYRNENEFILSVSLFYFNSEIMETTPADELESSDNTPMPEQPEPDEEESVSEVKECTSCPECIYYEKCISNAPERVQCKSNYLCLGSSCCEDFKSRKSIDDIYEEQKRTEPTYESENDSDYCDMLEEDDLPF